MKLSERRNLGGQRAVSLTTRQRAVVALGGGGARGLAHLGVMQAIAESDLRVERVVGVSIGSLVGASCAVEGEPRRAQAKAIELLCSPVFRKKQRLLTGAQPATAAESRGGLFSWYDRLKHFVAAHAKLGRAVTGPALLSDWLLQEVIECLVPDIDIEETRLPLTIVAADLLSGNKVALETGSLRTAIQASMAIPGIFPPVPHRGALLCDIGVLDSVPITVANAYPHDLSIAVDVGQGQAAIGSCQTALDVMVRMEEIGERMMRLRALRDANLVIRPEVGSVAWFDFSEPERLIQAGHHAAHRQLGLLRTGRVA